jgi:predicted nucleotidyltransferase
MIAITEEERTLVLDILQRHVPHCEVRVFGSRLKGGAKQYSDLDLAVCGQTKLPRAVIDDMRYDFQLSPLPFRLDVMDYYALSPEFRAIVDRGYEVIHAL